MCHLLVPHNSKCPGPVSLLLRGRCVQKFTEAVSHQNPIQRNKAQFSPADFKVKTSRSWRASVGKPHWQISGKSVKYILQQASFF